MKYRGEEVGQMSDEGLRRLVDDVRNIIQPIGSMHVMWDVVFDAETHLNGGTQVFCDRRTCERLLAEFAQQQTSRFSALPNPDGD